VRGEGLQDCKPAERVMINIKKTNRDFMEIECIVMFRLRSKLLTGNREQGTGNREQGTGNRE
jgi:hypothetical protein